MLCKFRRNFGLMYFNQVSAGNRTRDPGIGTCVFQCATLWNRTIAFHFILNLWSRHSSHYCHLEIISKLVYKVYLHSRTCKKGRFGPEKVFSIVMSRIDSTLTALCFGFPLECTCLESCFQTRTFVFVKHFKVLHQFLMPSQDFEPMIMFSP